MAIDAKKSLLNQTEKMLSSEVTANIMTKVLSIIADVIEGFDIKETYITDEQTDDLLECYIDALKVQGRSEKTLQRYRYVISRMMNTMKVPTRKITVYHLRNYLSKLKENGKQDSTMEGIRQVLSALLELTVVPCTSMYQQTRQCIILTGLLPVEMIVVMIIL